MDLSNEISDFFARYFGIWNPSRSLSPIKRCNWMSIVSWITNVQSWNQSERRSIALSWVKRKEACSERERERAWELNGEAKRARIARTRGIRCPRCTSWNFIALCFSLGVNDSWDRAMLEFDVSIIDLFARDSYLSTPVTFRGTIWIFIPVHFHENQTRSGWFRCRGRLLIWNYIGYGKVVPRIGSAQSLVLSREKY